MWLPITLHYIYIVQNDDRAPKKTHLKKGERVRKECTADEIEARARHYIMEQSLSSSGPVRDKIGRDHNDGSKQYCNVLVLFAHY